jgi:hypothetical protein
MKIRLLTVAAGALFVFTAFAHHSTANFDRAMQVEITGVVTRFQFSNPHSLIQMDVANDASGETQSYSVFATSRVVLLRYGWRPESINEGDSITVTGHPDFDNPHFVYMTGIRFADGSEWSRDEILE